MVRDNDPTWTSYRASIGDRSALFREVAQRWPVRRALYVGSYVDLAPSTAVAHVTYVDTDRRAARFFGDEARVREHLSGRVKENPSVQFLHSDFTGGLDVADASFDMLISLFTVPAWDSCRRYLKDGGLLLANASHGEASIAALDPRLRLTAVIEGEAPDFTVSTAELDTYLVPKGKNPIDVETIRASGKGVVYTRPAFAYIFEYSRDA